MKGHFDRLPFKGPVQEQVSGGPRQREKDPVREDLGFGLGFGPKG